MTVYRSSPRPQAKLARRTPWWRIAWAAVRGVFRRQRDAQLRRRYPNVPSWMRESADPGRGRM